jgi:hypothetical protein
MHLIDLVTSSPVLFYDFFPEFDRIVGGQFRNICHVEIEDYHASTNTSNVASTGYAAINCLYNSSVTDSATQINYGGTGVLLGLLPTILSILGSNTWETALLSTQRPVLSFLLALGAPVVTPARLFDFTDPRAFLELKGEKTFNLRQPKNKYFGLLLLVIEYALALAAIVNVTSIALDLSIKAASIGIAPISQRFHWLLWTYIAAVIHIFGHVPSVFTCHQLPPIRPSNFDELELNFGFAVKLVSRITNCPNTISGPFCYRRLFRF